MESRFVPEGPINLRILVHYRDAFVTYFFRIVKLSCIHGLQLGFVNVFIAPIWFCCFNTLKVINIRKYVRKFMTFKVLKQLNPIGAMKIFTTPNCNLCMQERLTIMKKLRDKHVILMNKNSEIYGACRHKTTFRWFCLSTDDPVLNGWKG